MSTKSIALALLLVTSTSTGSFSQSPHSGHGAGQHHGQQTPPPSGTSGMMHEKMPMMHDMMGGKGMKGGATAGSGHQGHGQASTTATPSTRAFEEANAKMHRDMTIAFTGNADVDFVRGMIPHHQGAIDMARVVLQHGSNDQTKKWANEIIAAQEREIGEMREWLAKNAR